MKKLIDRQTLIDSFCSQCTVDKPETCPTIQYGDKWCNEVYTILNAPTVDAVPVVYSEWIPKEKADTPYGLEMECANCGFSVIVNDALYFKFCPNCGAKMDGKDGDGNG